MAIDDMLVDEWMKDWRTERIVRFDPAGIGCRRRSGRSIRQVQDAIPRRVIGCSARVGDEMRRPLRSACRRGTRHGDFPAAGAGYGQRSKISIDEVCRERIVEYTRQMRPRSPRLDQWLRNG